MNKEEAVKAIWKKAGESVISDEAAFCLCQQVNEAKTEAEIDKIVKKAVGEPKPSQAPHLLGKSLTRTEAHIRQPSASV